ncbi:MAG: metallopeptidase family protein [Gemmatimonadota bacterium]
MNFHEFQARAEEIFEDIPADFKQGLEGIEVVRKTTTHPDLPEVYTLGECLSEFYPSEFGGPGEVMSRVVLYYGSFLALSRTHEDWDWEEELFETVTHEVRHHLEHLASEDALEEMDFAEDQNFARREGEGFEPLFFKAGKALGGGVYEVAGDVFIERPLGRGAEPGSPVEARWGDRSFTVRVPEDPGDIHFMRLADLEGDAEGEVYVVLVRRRGVGEWVLSLLGGRKVRVLESEAEVV